MVTLTITHEGGKTYVVEYDSGLAEAFGSGHEYHGPFSNDYAAQIFIESQREHSTSDVIQTGEV